MHPKRKDSLFGFLLAFAATSSVLVLSLRQPPPPLLLVLLAAVAGVTGLAAGRTFMTPDHFYRVEERRYRALNRRLQPWLLPIGLAALLLVILIQILGPQFRHWLYE